MHTRLLLLLSLSLSLVLGVPTASWAFLGPSSRTSISTELPPELSEVPPPAGIPGVAGRANPRTQFTVPAFPTEPETPSTPGDTVPEPTPGLLVALGLTVLALRRRSA